MGEVEPALAPAPVSLTRSVRTRRTSETRRVRIVHATLETIVRQLNECLVVTHDTPPSGRP